MKKLYFYFFSIFVPQLAAVIISSILAVSAVAETQNSSTLTVKVSGFDQVAGNVQISLYDSSSNWLETSTYNAVIPVESNTVVWNVSGLAPGQYAIAGFHDVNLNGECDRNFIGFPTESFGFSNNVRPKFRAPKWELTKFEFASGTQEVEITLR